MNCDELRGDYCDWALGIAEEPARSEIATHLARQCPDCVAGVRSAMATVALMSGAVKETDPPKRLRRRIVAMVAPESKRGFAAIPWIVSGLLAIALVSVAVTGSQKKPSPDVAKLAQALSILNDPTAKDVTFGDPAARGRVFVSSKGVVFIAAHLPQLQSNRTFQMWLIPAAGNPISAGIFRSSDDSSAVYVYPGQTSNAAAVAVTVEPEGGSPQPTTTPFIVTKL